MAAGKQQVSTGVVVAALALVVIIIGFLAWRFFGPRPAAPPRFPAGTPPLMPGDPRAYPQGMPRGLPQTPTPPGGRAGPG